MIKSYAYAKLNLALDVTKKRADGYHDLQMIMIPLELCDVLTFEPSDQLTLTSNIDIKDNMVLKAAKTLKEMYDVKQGAHITLEKNIPIGAGLAGGSADIAATLRGLNELWQLDLSLEALEPIALTLGSDTVFCLHNKPAFVFGRGEQLMFVDMPPIEMVYLFPSDISVSTAQVFKHHIVRYRPSKFDRLSILYLNGEFETFFKKTYNALLKTTLHCYPKLKRKYRQIRRLDRFANMTGSGSTFFSLTFPKKSSKIIANIEKSPLEVIKTRPKT